LDQGQQLICGMIIDSSNVSVKLLVKLNSSRATVVADLMKENGREWDSKILRENLIPMDMEVVLKIPWSYYNMEDVNLVPRVLRDADYGPSS
jgi:hypothetical protein